MKIVYEVVNNVVVNKMITDDSFISDNVTFFDDIPNGADYSKFSPQSIPLTSIEQLKNNLLNAHNSYIEQFVSGVGIGLLTIGIIQSKPTALAFSGWLAQVANDLKSRQDAVVADGQEINIDFSNNGAPPNTIWEVRAEVGL